MLNMYKCKVAVYVGDALRLATSCYGGLQAVTKLTKGDVRTYVHVCSKAKLLYGAN